MIKINKIFIFLFLLSTWVAFSIGGFFPFLVFYSLIITLTALYIYINIIKYRLSVKVIIEQRYYSAGDVAECTTQVNCDTLLPVPYIEVKSSTFRRDESNLGELVTLTTEENKWITNNVVFYSRGIYDFGKVKLKVCDLFNIMSFSKEHDVNVKIKVYPRIYDIQKVIGGGRDIFMETIDKNSSNEDQFTVKDVRKYRDGDSLKKVHWRLSAKYDELYVKNSDTISGEEVVLFIDMHKNNLDCDCNGIIEESIVDVSMSIINHIRQKDISISVFMNNISSYSFKITIKDEFNSLMEAITQIKSDGLIPMEEFIQQQCYRIHRMSRIIAVTVKLSEAFSNSMVALKTQGYSISVYYFLSDEASAYNDEKLNQWGITCTSFDNLILDKEESKWKLLKDA